MPLVLSWSSVANAASYSFFLASVYVFLSVSMKLINLRLEEFLYFHEMAEEVHVDPILNFTLHVMVETLVILAVWAIPLLLKVCQLWFGVRVGTKLQLIFQISLSALMMDAYAYKKMYRLQGRDEMVHAIGPFNGKQLTFARAFFVIGCILEFFGGKTVLPPDNQERLREE